MCATSSDNALQKTESEGGNDTGGASPQALTRLCSELTPEQGTDALIESIDRLAPGLKFKLALTRGGWHRLGGVIDRDYQRVAGSIVHWVEEQAVEDVDELVAAYEHSGYFATRLSGKTHFITAAYGEAPQDFIQIEIEELRETLDRPLVDPDWFPDSVEEFLEPIDYPRLETEPVGEAHYQFRRITNIAHLLSRVGSRRAIDDLHRFLADWSYSSAGLATRFCDHWVLALREYRDQEGLLRLTARPVPTSGGETADLAQVTGLRGTELARALHVYDRDLGYPFAWFFMMLGQRSANYALAEAVLADQKEAYDYLPARDLKVLWDWEARPYSV